jgi:transcriptional regulator with XRE-family HTH domain
MGNARPRLKLMPEKLCLIREYLNASQPVMAQLLELPSPSRVSEYENGIREPNLMVTLRYGRLGKVSMASVVDDDVSINEFREQLGKFQLASNKQDAQAKQGNTQRNKPVTLISGIH